MTIYLDLVLCLCFLCNAAILRLMMYVLKQSYHIYRLFLATVLATLYVPVVLYFPQSIYTSLLVKILYSILIIFVCCKIRSLAQLVKYLLTFYLLSFLAGGTLISIHHFMAYSAKEKWQSIFYYAKNIYQDDISLTILLLGFPLIIWMTKYWSDKLLMEHFIHEHIYEICLYFNNRMEETRAFLDSGNHLYDPLSQRPVIVCTASFIRNFFTEEDWDAISLAIQMNEPGMIPQALQSRFSIIPYRSVASQHYLFTIKPDKLFITANKRQIQTKGLLVGIQLAELGPEAEYQCLLHPHLLTLKASYPLAN